MANKFRENTSIEEEQIEAVVEETKVETTSKPSKPRKKGVLAKGLSSVFSGTFLTNEKTLTYLPFVLFLGFVAIFYIAYNYYADDNIRLENKLNKEIKESRSEYISTKSDLMFASKQSEVAKAALEIGLKESVVPPVKILADSLQLYKKSN